MSKILICEDEPDAKESLASILKDRGYDVYTTEDGEQAVKAARQNNPDLILLDIRMPKLDGLEVAKEVRKYDAVTKIIFISAFQSPELVKEAAKYNFSDYILKPTYPESLLQAVEQA